MSLCLRGCVTIEHIFNQQLCSNIAADDQNLHEILMVEMGASAKLIAYSV